MLLMHLLVQQFRSLLGKRILGKLLVKLMQQWVLMVLII